MRNLWVTRWRSSRSYIGLHFEEYFSFRSVETQYTESHYSNTDRQNLDPKSINRQTQWRLDRESWPSHDKSDRCASRRRRRQARRSFSTLTVSWRRLDVIELAYSCESPCGLWSVRVSTTRNVHIRHFEEERKGNYAWRSILSWRAKRDIDGEISFISY